MNNKVNFLRGTSTEYATSTKDNDTFYYTTDDEKLYLGETEITGIEIDDTSTTTTDKTWSAKKINDSIPTELPANGGNADTVDNKHASDFSQIINLGDISTDTKTAIGIQYKSTTYWCSHWTDYPAGLKDGQGIIIAVNYKGSGTTGTDSIWCLQLYICPHDSRIYKRTIIGKDVGSWVSIVDNNIVASSTASGIVSTGAQTFAGNKTFNGQVIPAGATAYGTPQARKLSSGTVAATWDTATSTGNCPVGAWYGKHS